MHPLSSNIRQLRENRGLSLSQLAERSGVSKSYLSDLERGKRNLNTRTMAKLAAVLEVPPSSLIHEFGSHEVKDHDRLAGSDKEQRLLEAFSTLGPEDQDAVLSLIEAMERLSRRRVSPESERILAALNRAPEKLEAFLKLLD